MIIKKVSRSFFTSGALNIEKRFWDFYKINELVKSHSKKETSSQIKVFINGQEHLGNLTRDDTKYKDGSPTIKFRFWIDKSLALSNFRIDDFIYFNINNIENDISKSAITLIRLADIEGMSLDLCDACYKSMRSERTFFFHILSHEQAESFRAERPSFDRDTINDRNLEFAASFRKHFIAKVNFGKFLIVLKVNGEMAQKVMKERILALGKPKTLEELGMEFTKTRERVRQVESQLTEYIDFLNFDLKKFKDDILEINLNTQKKEKIKNILEHLPNSSNINDDFKKELYKFRNKIFENYLLKKSDDDESKCFHEYISIAGGYEKVFNCRNNVYISSLAYLALVKWYKEKYGELPKCKDITERNTSMREFLATKIPKIRKKILEGSASQEERKEFEKLGLVITSRRDIEKDKFQSQLEKFKLYINKYKKMPTRATSEFVWYEMKQQKHVPDWQKEEISKVISHVNRSYGIDLEKRNTAIKILEDFAHEDYINDPNPENCLISKRKLKKYESLFFGKITFKDIISKIAYNKKWYDVALENGFDKIEIYTSGTYDVINSIRAKKHDFEDD